eukprot:jgi/Chlat1/5255/Chrsp33S05089
MFNYTGPVITSVDVLPTDVLDPTTGAPLSLTINGTNFGPVGPLAVAIKVGGVSIPNARVVISDTSISIPTFPPGSGGPYDITLVVGSQSTGPVSDTTSTTPANGSGVKKFTYTSPSVVSASTGTSFFGGTLVSIFGANFGCVTGSSACQLPNTPSVVSVSVAGSACGNVVVFKELFPSGHGVQITCTAPPLLRVPTITNKVSMLLLLLLLLCPLIISLNPPYSPHRMWL